MQVAGILPEPVVTGQNPPPLLPTYNDIVNAPESEWRVLVALVDGNPAFYAAARSKKSKPESRRPCRQSSRHTDQTTRYWSAGAVLQRQTGRAMLEMVNRVNASDDNDDLVILETVV